MHRLQERQGVHPSELAMVEDLRDDHEVLLRSLQGSLAGNASLHFDFGTTDFLTRGHAGARKDGLDVAFGSRESSQFEEMTGRAGGHPKGRAESKRRSQPV